jgi:hypothetical protein
MTNDEDIVRLIKGGGAPGARLNIATLPAGDVAKV